MKKIVTVVVILCVSWFIFSMITKPKIKNLNNAGSAIVAFGDSLTYGHGAAQGEDYPSKLAKKVSMPVINLGVSGDKSMDGLARMDAIWEHNPYMVLIEFGGNDRMQQTSFAQTLSAIEKIVDETQAHGAIAVIVDTGGPFMSQYTKAYKKMAKEKGAVFVPGILDGIMLDPKLKSDAVHPNAEGYSIVADRVYKAIEKYLKY
ncbi:MAG: GDSL-type esterase/lipase family protein [Elusimicrobia bacterium]|nr:GDSL-type esterase/lipase family protein [Elusimicrobiota bacterium]